MARPRNLRRTLLFAAALIAAAALGLVLWRILPISCPSQPEWWMVGC
jgi:hypothetical protein